MNTLPFCGLIGTPDDGSSHTTSVLPLNRTWLPKFMSKLVACCGDMNSCDCVDTAPERSYTNTRPSPPFQRRAPTTTVSPCTATTKLFDDSSGSDTDARSGISSCCSAQV